MTNYIHLVFSDPPEGVSEDQYNDWYDAHVQEILAVDGWHSATRYRLDPVVDPAGDRWLPLPLGVRAGPAARDGRGQPGRGRHGLCRQLRLEEGGRPGSLPLPEWFTGIRFGSWNCTQVGDRITLESSTD